MKNPFSQNCHSRMDDHYEASAIYVKSDSGGMVKLQKRKTKEL
jgi:hypothetical protein